MQDLIALYRHNTWANRKVFDLASRQGADVLDAEAPGTRDTATGTLKHLARVEYAYLMLMEQRGGEVESRETYETRDLAWFRDHVQEMGASFLRLLESATDEVLSRDLRIPWFDFPITVRDGLCQVLTHSAQHRSQVLSWLSSQGVQTPDLDYVLMMREGVRA